MLVLALALKQLAKNVDLHCLPFVVGFVVTRKFEVVVVVSLIFEQWFLQTAVLFFRECHEQQKP